MFRLSIHFIHQITRGKTPEKYNFLVFPLTVLLFNFYACDKYSSVCSLALLLNL